MHGLTDVAMTRMHELHGVAMTRMDELHELAMTQMRVLHEDVISRIALLNETLNGRTRSRESRKRTGKTPPLAGTVRLKPDTTDVIMALPSPRLLDHFCGARRLNSSNQGLHDDDGVRRRAGLI